MRWGRRRAAPRHVSGGRVTTRAATPNLPREARLHERERGPTGGNPSDGIRVAHVLCPPYPDLRMTIFGSFALSARLTRARGIIAAAAFAACSSSAVNGGSGSDTGNVTDS